MFPCSLYLLECKQASPIQTYICLLQNNATHAVKHITIIIQLILLALFKTDKNSYQR